MHQNTPNYDSNIHFGPPWSPGGGLGGSKSKFDPRRGFFAPNQKVQKTKYVFICPMNNTELVVGQNFEIGTLSPLSTIGQSFDTSLASRLVSLLKSIFQFCQFQILHQKDIDYR